MNSIKIAEHLQTVHFTLVAVCIGLMLTMLMDTSDSINKAYEDIRKIRQIIEFEKDWNSELINKEAEITLEAYTKNHPSVIKPITSIELFNKKFLNSPSKFKIIRQWTILSKELYKKFSESKDVQSFSGNFLSIPHVGSTYAGMFSLDEITKLGEFRNQWDILTHINFIRILDSQNPPQEALFFFVEENLNYDSNIKTFTSKRIKNFEFGKVSDISNKKENILDLFLTCSLEIFPDEYNKFLPLEEQSIVRQETVLRGNLVNLSGNDVIFFIPIKTFNIPFNPQLALAKRFKTDWQPGKFEDTFPELYIITKEWMNDISLEGVEKILLSEKKRSGGEKFEFIGMKIPASDLNKWGSLILISIQAYFYLHLRAFLNRITVEDEALEVPWIGLYSGFIPKTIVLLTGVLLPISVSIILWWKGSRFEKISWHLYFGGVVFLVSIILAGVAANELRKLWKIIYPLSN